MNENRTDAKNDTPLTQVGSRYELIDKDGNVRAVHSSVAFLAGVAKAPFPDQEQDEDRTGKGWDVQVVGADR